MFCMWGFRLGSVLAVNPSKNRTHPLGRGRVPEFLWVFEVVGRVPLVSGRVSFPPGPILESVFLWRVSVDRNLPVAAQTGTQKSKVWLQENVIGRAWLGFSAKPDANSSQTCTRDPPRPRFGDLWMWLQLVWLQLEVVRDPVGVVWGRFGAGLGPQAGAKSTLNDPDRTLDNFKLLSHEL